MNILVIGAGIAGLSFAHYLKQTDRSHRITILEKHAEPHATGYGVTFPPGTFSFIAGYDSLPETPHTTLRGVETYYNGQRLRADDEWEFCAIARASLLTLLRRACASDGTEIRFGQEVTNLADMNPDDFDLVVAADGVHSTIREQHRDLFGASIVPATHQYAWLATDLRPTGMIEHFIKDQSGVFASWTYGFAPAASTFIVQCSRTAGIQFEGLSPEQTRTRLSQIFAPHLQGHRVLGLEPIRWRHFANIRCERWSYKNVLLLGDAQHATHYCIGSGTFNAVFDAIFLATQLCTEGDVSRALRAFEEGRTASLSERQEAALQFMKADEDKMDKWAVGLWDPLAEVK